MKWRVWNLGARTLGEWNCFDYGKPDLETSGFVGTMIPLALP